MESHGQCPMLPKGGTRKKRKKKKMGNGEAEELAINQRSLTGTREPFFFSPSESLALLARSEVNRVVDSYTS